MRLIKSPCVCHASLGFVFRFAVGFTGLKIEHPTQQFERLNEPQVLDLNFKIFFLLGFVFIFIL